VRTRRPFITHSDLQTRLCCLWSQQAQFIRNDTTALASAINLFDCNSTWMLSGTPLTNKLEDLQGEMSLLRVWPFTLGKGSDAGWMNHFWEVRGLLRQPVALSLVRAAAGRPPDHRSLARSLARALLAAE